MSKSLDTTKAIQWQTLAIVAIVLVVAALLTQFFFLSEEIEDTRSRNAKLSIAEILAKQQQARLKSVSFQTQTDLEFSRAAEKMAAVQKEPANTVQESATYNVKQDIRNNQNFQAVSFVSRQAVLLGVIRHDNYRVAIIQLAGSSDPQVYSEGDILTNDVTISKVLDESIIIQSNKDKDVQLTVKISGAPLIGKDQASFNFLNLPNNQNQR